MIPLNKISKTIIILLIVLLLGVFINQTIYATSVIDPISNPDAYKPGDNTGNSKLADKGKIIISTIQIVGVVASVLALMVIGFRYMFGSVEDKANYKELLIPYIIGVVLLFSITTIIQIIYDFVTGLQ